MMRKGGAEFSHRLALRHKAVELRLKIFDLFDGQYLREKIPPG
jgi:hypothetical protein